MNDYLLRDIMKIRKNGANAGMQKYLILKKKKVLTSGMVPAELCNHAFIPREGAVTLF